MEVASGSTNSGIVVNIIQQEDDFFSHSWIQEWILIYDIILFSLICSIIFVIKFVKR